MRMHAFVRLSVAIALTAVSLSLAARKESELPEFTEDGLQLRQGSKLAIVYAEPGAELSAYRRVQLLDAYVAFKKGWEKEQRRSTTESTRISSKDIERIRTDLVAKALDRRVDSQHGAYYTWANRATNRAAADRILQGWADILVNALTAAQTSDGDGTAMAGEESE